MATFKLLLHSANKRKNGSYPVSLRITKNMKHKYISLGLYGKKEEWDVCSYLLFLGLIFTFFFH